MEVVLLGVALSYHFLPKTGQDQTIYHFLKFI